MTLSIVPPKRAEALPPISRADLVRERIRRPGGLAFFVREFWDEVIADPCQWAPHMDVLCDELQRVYERIFMRYAVDDTGRLIAIGRLPKEYDLIINVPPGTSKSTIASQMAQAWAWAIDPTLRFICASFNKAVGLENSEKMRNVTLCEKYREYFPQVQLVKASKAKGNFKTTKLGQRFTASVGSGVTGIHAHLINIDDPVDPKAAVSVALLETANRWIDNTLATRLADKTGSPTILVMQRLAMEDPTQKLLDKAKKDGLRVRHICLPGILDENVKPLELASIYQGGLLDGKRLSVSALQELRIKLGAAGFAGQIQQRPAPAGGLVWKKWFIVIPDEVFPAKSAFERYGTDWDLAYTKEDGNAATAFITAGVIGNRIYIDDLGWTWEEYVEMIKYMKLRPSPHYIEAKASGKSARSSLANAGIVAIEVPVPGGADKVARARMATPPAEAGLVYIRASLVDRLYNDEKQGILYFPKGSHADLADVLAQMILRLSNGGQVIIGDNAADEDDDPPLLTSGEYDDDDGED